MPTCGAWARRSSPPPWWRPTTVTAWCSPTSGTPGRTACTARTWSSSPPTTPWPRSWSARGELSEEEAAVHPHRHILTRALGVQPEVDVDVWELVPEEGDRFLLCSDGLTNEVPPEQIAERPRRAPATPGRRPRPWCAWPTRPGATTTPPWSCLMWHRSSETPARAAPERRPGGGPTVGAASGWRRGGRRLRPAGDSSTGASGIDHGGEPHRSRPRPRPTSPARRRRHHQRRRRCGRQPFGSRGRSARPSASVTDRRSAAPHPPSHHRSGWCSS